jgi:hypothetical protein
VFTRIRHLSLSWARSVHYKPFHLISWFLLYLFIYMYSLIIIIFNFILLFHFTCRAPIFVAAHVQSSWWWSFPHFQVDHPPHLVPRLRMRGAIVSRPHTLLLCTVTVYLYRSQETELILICFAKQKHIWQSGAYSDSKLTWCWQDIYAWSHLEAYPAQWSLSSNNLHIIFQSYDYKNTFWLKLVKGM